MADQNNERTFTQDEVNAMISDRLNRERNKLASEARKTAFTTEWSKRGYSQELLDSLEADENGRIDAAKVFSVLDQLHPAEPEGAKNLPRFTNPIGDNSPSNLESMRFHDAFGLNKRRKE